MVYFHVTSTLNRTSIRRHGLDWSRMAAASGIAGSTHPEVDGVFLCRDSFEADFFVGLNNSSGPVDVWSVEGIDDAELIESPEGFAYLPSTIPAGRLTLVRTEGVRVRPSDVPASSGAYSSTLTIVLDDGTVLRDDAAREHMTHRR